MRSVLLRLVAFLQCTSFAVFVRDYQKDYEAPEPFEMLNGHCSNCNPERPFSPDPLVQTTWIPDTNTSELQVYRIFFPENYTASPQNAFKGLEMLSKHKAEEGSHILQVSKSATLMLDFGVEIAGWFEFISPNLGASNVTVRAGLSEFNSPYPGKTKEVKQYGSSTFRLETNDELYEGVRFTWLFFDFPGDHGLRAVDPLVISNVSLVGKVKPVNYTGSLESSDAALNKVWYTGAYAVRLNMEANGFNSILIERGDRVAIQGDARPSMAAALVAFAPYDLIHSALQNTNSGHIHGHHVVDEYIMAYPLYWTLSVHDWFMASGDQENFLALLPDVRSIVKERIHDFLSPNLDITWMGWDDRLGNGWCFHKNHDQCPREAHLAFAALVIRACNDLASSMTLCGMEREAERFKQTSRDLSRRFRQVPEYPSGLDVHSATNAINAKLATELEIEEWMSSLLNNPVTICSWSPFNQFWILQAFGNAGRMQHALASIHLCWQPMTELGHGCFWELFSPEWPGLFQNGDMMPTMPSYCHPWSSGVTAWMSHVLGGITPLLPGYKEFVAAPYVSAKYPAIAVEMPTPEGSIKVNATLSHGRDSARQCHHVITIRLKCRTPGYVGVANKLDGFDRMLQKVFVNGVETEFFDATTAGDKALESHFHPSQAAGLAFVRIESRKEIVIQAKYKGENHFEFDKPQHIPPFPEPRYPASVSFDRKSRGDGIYKYGSDGYVLFGHYENGTDLSALPDYVRSVTAHQHGFAGWVPQNSIYKSASKDNSSYLPNPGNRSEERKIGSLGMGVDTYWEPGLLIDIQLEDRNMKESLLLDVKKKGDTESRNQHYFISLYCLAMDQAEEFAIRVMDLSSNSVIAPTAKVSGYGAGIWWTLQYNGSVRLRVMSIKGFHLSAITFKSGDRKENEVVSEKK